MAILRFLHKLFRFVKWNLFLKRNNFYNDTWYYVLNRGIGDTYMVSSLIPHLLQFNDKFVFIIEKNNQIFIPEIFNCNIKIVKDLKLPHSLINEFGRFERGNPIVLHPLNLVHSRLEKLIGYKDYNLMDIYKVLLGIDLANQPHAPVILAEDKQRANKLIIDFSIEPKKVVLLCPQANSISTISKEIWLKISSDIVKAGLIPVFLNDNLDSDYQQINFPLQDAVSFCNELNSVVSLRSGFCDLISSCNILKIIIYPGDAYTSQKLLSNYGLKNLGLNNGENLIEIPFAIDSDLENLRLTIISCLTLHKTSK